MDAVFLLGAGEAVAAPVRIDDLLLLPCPDGYDALPQRTRAFCEWALARGDWDYLFKCDDDTYVAIDRLAGFNPGRADYLGAEWTPGVEYASGGAGYLLSRRAAQIVAANLTAQTGAEDQLVGSVLRDAGVPFRKDDRFIAYGDRQRRPRPDNRMITTHAVSRDLCLQSHRDATSAWRFRIVMPTSDGYARHVVPVTLSLLARYWPDHPPVDVLHYEVEPPEFPRTARLWMDEQAALTWPATLAAYLQRYNADQLVLLMLDDYGLCGRPRRQAIREVQDTMLADPTIGNIHLTWQPAVPKEPWKGLLKLPRWPYSINTQAALWRRDLLLETLQLNLHSTSDEVELDGSRWFNDHRFESVAHCQVDMPEPSNPSGYVDETDKSGWALPYHNLMHRGCLCTRHGEFLAAHGLAIADEAGSNTPGGPASSHG